MENKSYCIKCKVKTETMNQETTKTKNNRTMLKGKCAQCGTIKTRFIKGSGLISGLNIPLLSPIAGLFGLGHQ